MTMILKILKILGSAILGILTLICIIPLTIFNILYSIFNISFLWLYNNFIQLFTDVTSTAATADDTGAIVKFKNVTKMVSVTGEELNQQPYQIMKIREIHEVSKSGVTLVADIKTLDLIDQTEYTVYLDNLIKA